MIVSTWMHVRTIHRTIVVRVAIAETVNKHEINDLCIFVATVKLSRICNDFTIVERHKDFVRNTKFVRSPHTNHRFSACSSFGRHFHCDFTINKSNKTLIKSHIVPISPYAFSSFSFHHETTTTQFVSQQFRKFILIAIHLHDRVELTKTIIHFIRVSIIMILIAIDKQLIEISTRTEQHRNLIQSLFVQSQIRSQRRHPIVHLTSNLNTTNLATIRVVSKSIVEFIAFAHRHRVCHTIHPKIDIRHRVHLFATIEVKRKFIFAQCHSERSICRRNRINTRRINNKITSQHFSRTNIHQRERVRTHTHRFIRLITNLRSFATAKQCCRSN